MEDSRSRPFLRARTRSRLMDPPPSTAAKSMQMPNSSGVTEEDDDLFEDLPEELKSTKMSNWTILELIGLFLAIAALICSLAMQKIEPHTFWGLHLWKWEVLVMVIISGHLLSEWFTHIILFLLERNSLTCRRIIYFVYGLRRKIQSCIWISLILLCWHLLFNRKAVEENSKLSHISKVLFCIVIALVLLLIKTILIKALGLYFHASTYFDRIQQSLLKQYAIEILSGYGGTRLKSFQIGKSTKLSGSVSKKDANKHQQGGITIGLLHKLNQKNISAWNMKRMMRIIRLGMLNTLDEKVIGFEEDESTMEIKTEHEAKIMARKIFNNIAKPGAKYICLVDLMRFMSKDEAVKIMSLLNETQDDRVSKRILKNWVVNVFRDRKALSLTLNDTKTAVNKLNQIATVIVAIIVIAIWLLILNVATTHFFLFFASQILLFTFVYGDTFQRTFEAIIFLFVMHPFDVGDHCEVNGVQLRVEEMNILSTTFLTNDYLKITYPNSMLAKLPISNFYRSPDMVDNIDFFVHASTPLEKLAVMREQIILFIERKKEHWYPGAQVVMKDIDDNFMLKISISMQHRINLQHMEMTLSRRGLILEELIRILTELDIQHDLHVVVNNFNFPPATSGRLPSN